jgi:hypothetical protein
MRKSAAALIAASLVLALAGTGHAQRGHGGGHGGGGVRGGGGGFHGGGFHGGGGFPGGGHFRGGGHFHGGGRVIIGVGPGWGWWGSPYWYYPPAYVAPPYYGYGYYDYPPPADVEPPAYVQRGPEESEQPERYWYYCPSAKAYYPQVKRCPEEWLRVLPRTSDDDD